MTCDAYTVPCDVFDLLRAAPASLSILWRYEGISQTGPEGRVGIESGPVGVRHRVEAKAGIRALIPAAVGFRIRIGC